MESEGALDNDGDKGDSYSAFAPTIPKKEKTVSYLQLPFTKSFPKTSSQGWGLTYTKLPRDVKIQARPFDR